MLKRLAGYYRPYKGLLVLDLFFALLMAVFDLFYPVITSNIIDDYVPNRRLERILVWMGILLALYLLKAASKYIINYYGHILGVRIQRDMRREVFRKLQTLPFSYFDGNETGTIMSRIVNDLMEISEMCHHGPEELFVVGVTLIGAFSVLSASSLPLTLIIFAAVPFIAWLAIVKKKKMNQAFAEARKEIGCINADLQSSISGVRVSRAFTAEEHEQERFDRSNERFKAARETSYRVMADYFSLLHLTGDLLYWIGLAATAVFAFYGRISLGDIAMYVLYINLIVTAIRRLMDFAEMYEMGMTGFARFLELMDCESEKQRPDAVELPAVRGAVELQNVAFTYGEGKQVLRGVSLRIEPGQKLALVGPSGSGKTTLCHLLPRFYEVGEGAIYIDGVDITTVTLASLRRNIGIVQQDVFLFNGTFRENIAYGDFSASDEEIEGAARLAHIHDYIMSLPQGYDTPVGERGIRLSGGQRQRISIARVFLKNPPILILDEATSALDNASEQMIQRALDALCRGRTTLVVAHRLSTIREADKIAVLTENGIEEQGTHDELLARHGIYAGLYYSQFGQEAER